MAQLDVDALNELNYSGKGQFRPNRFITAQLMEALTGLPDKTLYDWNKKGWIRAVTINDDSSRLLVDVDHFNATLDSRLGEEVEYGKDLENE